MTYFERLALLGDKDMQKLCTKLGVVLPCPMCGKTLIERKMGYWFETASKPTNLTIVEHPPKTGCHLDNLCFVKENGLGSWNTRQAAQIRSCRECTHIRYNEENDPYCSYENGLGDPYEWDFCSYFESKCSEEK